MRAEQGRHLLIQSRCSLFKSLILSHSKITGVPTSGKPLEKNRAEDRVRCETNVFFSPEMFDFLIFNLLNLTNLCIQVSDVIS